MSQAKAEHTTVTVQEFIDTDTWKRDKARDHVRKAMRQKIAAMAIEQGYLLDELPQETVSDAGWGRVQITLTAPVTLGQTQRGEAS